MCTFATRCTSEENKPMQKYMSTKCACMFSPSCWKGWHNKNKENKNKILLQDSTPDHCERPVSEISLRAEGVGADGQNPPQTPVLEPARRQDRPFWSVLYMCRQIGSRISVFTFYVGSTPLQYALRHLRTLDPRRAQNHHSSIEGLWY